MRRCTSCSKITAACNTTEINSKANAKRGKMQKKVSEAHSKVSGCQYAHGYSVHKTIKQIDITHSEIHQYTNGLEHTQIKPKHGQRPACGVRGGWDPACGRREGATFSLWKVRGATSSLWKARGMRGHHRAQQKMADSVSSCSDQARGDVKWVRVMKIARIGPQGSLSHR